MAVKMHENIRPAAKGTLSLRTYLQRHWQLYVFLGIPLVYILIFNYYPMYGAQIAFKEFDSTVGIWGSPWVGLKQFIKFFASPECYKIIGNTLNISLYSLIAGFPTPIILALAMNCLNAPRFKRIVQTVTYMPYFISTTVMVGIILQFLSLRGGIVNNMIEAIGLQRINFMNRPDLFTSIYVWSGVWQYSGWGSIIYLAVLAGVDPNFHEAAIIDGASRFKRIIYIDLPSILPTMIILLLLNVGQIMNVGFEKVFLMQNPLNTPISEIIQTYVYRIGLVSALPNYSYAAAIGLFNSIINLLLLVLVNFIAKKATETSLW